MRSVRHGGGLKRAKGSLAFLALLPKSSQTATILH